jgi:hypothetical protein
METSVTMNTREYYDELNRRCDLGDAQGMVALMGEHFGKLEGDLSGPDSHDIYLMMRWAKRLVEPEEYAAAQARVDARIAERFAREGKPERSTDPNAPPPLYRLW